MRIYIKIIGWIMNILRQLTIKESRVPRWRNRTTCVQQQQRNINYCHKIDKTFQPLKMHVMKSRNYTLVNDTVEWFIWEETHVPDIHLHIYINLSEKDNTISSAFTLKECSRVSWKKLTKLFFLKAYIVADGCSRVSFSWCQWPLMRCQC